MFTFDIAYNANHSINQDNSNAATTQTALKKPENSHSSTSMFRIISLATYCSIVYIILGRFLYLLLR